VQLSDAAEAALATAVHNYPEWWAPRIKTVLDQVAADPQQAAVRRHAFRHPDGGTVWGIPVRGGRYDWIVLWEYLDGEPWVHYIGPEV
jgi:hypothetical protein